MSNSTQRSYYEDDVQNATPQRLRLMLIEGAMRFAKQSVSVWESDHDAAHTALGRCRNIIIELIASIRGDRESCEYFVDHIVREHPLAAKDRNTEVDNLEQISRAMLSTYLVVYRQLDEAQLSGESEKIEEAVAILEVERETAQMVCNALPDAPILNAPRAAANITSNDAAETLRAENTDEPTGPATYGDTTALPTSSMSFEA